MKFSLLLFLPIMAQAEEKKSSSVVVAMEAQKAGIVHAGEIVTAGGEPMVLVARNNQKFELSPRSVAEFDEHNAMRLLRGSVVVESKEESSLRTAGAKVDFVGKVIVSYDHLEKSSSAFVLEGEARLVNPHREDSTLRLQRFRGATLVVGDVVPQLIRQLDVGAVQEWLEGYAWPADRRKAMLQNMPGEKQVVVDEVPKHLEEAKIEDYFSSIDTADEYHQPEYYDRKFDDPDKVVAEQNSKTGIGKALSPEEAALISLPKTQIDLGFELGPEILSKEEKRQELAVLDPKTARAPASIHAVEKKKTPKKKPVPVIQGDPEVNLVLERLRRLKGENALVSGVPGASREPASENSPVVPDPVYDYSQNF